MVEQLSPLEPVWKPGAHGKVLGGAGVALEETRPGSIVQAAAFPGEETRADRGDRPEVTGLACPTAPAAASSRGQVGLRHRARTLPGGRPERRAWASCSRRRCRPRSARSPTCRMAARRSASPARNPNGCWPNSSRSTLRWRRFPEGAGRSTAHHDIFAQIQRTGGRAVRPLRLPLLRALVLDGAVPRQRRGRLRGEVAGAPALSP